jgi:RNA polymerase sigma-70 factor (ECF subfamily)
MSIGYLSPVDSSDDVSDASIVDIAIHSSVDSSEFREAFEALFCKYKMVVFSLVLKRLRNKALAEDLTQDIFLHAQKKIHQLQNSECFPGWIKQITVRMAINYAMRNKHAQDLPLAMELFGTDEEDDANLILRQEAVDTVRSAIQRLNALDQETLQDFYFEDLSLKQMAESLSVPIGTIKRRLFTARNRLREKIMELFPGYIDEIKKL